MSVSQSVIKDKFNNIIIRTYTNIHDGGSEYFETTFPIKEARSLAIEILNRCEMADYCEEQEASTRRRKAKEASR